MPDAHSPKTTCEMWVNVGLVRHKGGPLLSFGKGIMGGMLLSMGGLVSLAIGSEASRTTTYPGLDKLLVAAIFPIGLIMIILSGAELVTASMAVFFMSTVKRKTPWWSGAVNVGVVATGNLVGSLLVAGLFGKGSGMFDSETYTGYVVSFATNKVVTPSWGNIFVRGIACNFLVCYAVWQATSARDLFSKVVAIELPVFLFVACGYDHSIANMLFIPLGIMLGAPFGTGYYIWKSLIPSFVGNFVGALFMAVPMSYFYLFDATVLPGAGAAQEGSGFGNARGRKEDATVRVQEAESETSTF